MQFQENVPWIAAFNVNYHLGVDGISMPLIILTTFTTVLVVLAGWQVIQTKSAQYMAAFLIMEGLMIGVFAALDAVLFYVFWEAMLMPMFLIIGIWGGPNRVYATIKFFLYTFLGSVFMLVALIYMYLKSGSFSILDFHLLPLAMTEQVLIFLAFLMAFAVKVPMWPVHTWLPDAHVEAPTGGSVMLAAIMLKIGGYGFLRFSLPITPDASHALDWLIIVHVTDRGGVHRLRRAGAAGHEEADRLFVDRAHGLCHPGHLPGVHPAREHAARIDGAALGMEGGMVQMISHGFISGALFLCVGVLYDRVHSRQITDYGGVVNTMPVFAAFMVLFAMANSGLPGTSGFVGEFMVILASFKANFWFAFLAATTLILGAAYSLWMVKRVVFGDIANDNVRQLEDVNGREFVHPRQPGRGGAVLWSLAGATDRCHACQCRQPAGALSRVQVAVQETGVALLKQCSPETLDMNISLSDFLPLAPEIFLLSMACLILVVEAFFGERRRSISYLLSQLTLLVAAIISWNMLDTGAAVVLGGTFVHDPMAALLKTSMFLVVIGAFVYARSYLGQRQPARRVLRAWPVRRAGHDGDDLGAQPADHLPRTGTAVAVAVCHGGIRPRFRRRLRGGDEILRARRAGLGHAALRHVDALWRHRYARSRGASPRPWRTPTRPAWC